MAIQMLMISNELHTQAHPLWIMYATKRSLSDRTDTISLLTSMATSADQTQHDSTVLTLLPPPEGMGMTDGVLALCLCLDEEETLKEL
jgi:hypothetical protein